MLVVIDLQFFEMYSGLATRCKAGESKGKEAAASKGCGPLPGSRWSPQCGLRHLTLRACWCGSCGVRPSPAPSRGGRCCCPYPFSTQLPTQGGLCVPVTGKHECSRTSSTVFGSGPFATRRTLMCWITSKEWQRSW